MAAIPTTSPSINAFPPPPPGLNYIAAIRPSITFLMIGTVFSGILIPLLVALFYFSTTTTRQKPIFILNFLSITFGLALGIYNAYIEITALLSPLKPFWRYHELVFSVMMSAIPWLVETTLLVRLLAVYPYSRTEKRIWFSIFIPLVLLKIARIINTSIFNALYSTQLRVHPYDSPLASSQTVWQGRPNTKVEWILQVIDNTATSVLFIIRLRGSLNAPERKDSFLSDGYSYTARLKGLFWIAVSNFVFPVIFSIIQLILLFHDPSYLTGADIFIVNDYVEIIGVLLATVWTTSNHWTDQKASPRSASIETAPRFASNFRLGSQPSQSATASGTIRSVVEINTRMAKRVDNEVELGQLKSRPDFAPPEKVESL